MKSYKEITQDILADIASKKLKVDDKLPSEQGISIKYGVSRIVASRVFSLLRKIGAIYTIPKKGNYVARYFQGLIKPIGFEYDIDKMIDMPMDHYIPDFFAKNGWDGNFKVVKRFFNRNDKTIIKSENWIDKNIAISSDIPIIDSVLSYSNVVSSVLFLRFEKFDENDDEKSLVTYRVVYSSTGISLISRYTINEEDFLFIKQEFII